MNKVRNDKQEYPMNNDTSKTIRRVFNRADIAKICHQANKAYCEALADMSQPTWENAPEWQRQSAINGVEFHLANPDAGPSGSHENWYKVKDEEGWVYGEVKDPEAKTHPCMVPFDSLPIEQQMKDRIFVAIVHAMASVVE